MQPMHSAIIDVIVKIGNITTFTLEYRIMVKLGNSGDAFRPHLHYQLQSGPRLFQDQALPFNFQDADDSPL
jgi:hypothetical protein